MKKTREKTELSELTTGEKDNFVKNVLVTASSVSGMKTALEISRLGLKITLLEKETELQDNHADIVDQGTVEIRNSLLQKIEKDKNINVVSPASIIKIEGTAGNFSVKIKKDNDVFFQKYGAVVIAGQNLTETVPVFLNFHNTGIMSQQKLGRLLGDSPHTVSPVIRKAKTIAFVFNDSGENSRKLTMSGLKYTCLLKKNTNCEVYVFISHLIVDSGGMEKLYREARVLGVIFIKYNENYKIISNKNGSIGIAAKDIFLDADIELFCDILVIGEKFIPCIQEDGLKTGYDTEGFYQDANVYLYPVSSRRRGIYFVGECRGDQDMMRTNVDVLNAALNSYELLSGFDIHSGGNVKVESEKCKVCLTCIRVCPHQAIRLVPFSDPAQQEAKNVAGIFPEACYDCGACSAMCPAKAIDFEFKRAPLNEYSDEQILKEIECLKQDDLPVFCCAESAFLAAERAVEINLYYSPRVKIIRVPCIGRVDLIHLFKAFEQKVPGVLLAGCPEQACTHLEGNIRAKDRVKYARELLKGMGIGEERLGIVFIGPDMAHRFVREISEMLERCST
ncbi:MAG: hydrogenase iron-sulfur subunit [Spirochaetales bacterium]|nr:hydrogenase iron-sulfur subunit [Spirochaetales bacterium]